MSKKRTVASPKPLARSFPSGLKATVSTTLESQEIVAEQ